MSKIRTHYDNLKVSRNAPAEVIRAAYKVLTQKYHPDKNPGDAGAARIMHIISSSYDVLSDPQQRAAHDVWIADIEREAEDKKERRWRKNANTSGLDGIAELEHRLATELKERKRLERLLALERQRSVDFYTSHPIPEGSSAKLPKRWLKIAGLVLPLVLIALLLILAYRAGKVDAGFRKLSRGIPRLAASLSCPKPSVPADAAALQAPATVVRPKTAPNGLSWPRQAEYLAGSKVLRESGAAVANIDNSRNGSDVLARLVEVKTTRGLVQPAQAASALPPWQSPQELRIFFIPAYGSFALKKIEPGSYEIHYQDLEHGVGWQSDVITVEDDESSSVAQKPPNLRAAVQINMLLYRGPADSCKASQLLKSTRNGASAAARGSNQDVRPLSYLLNKVYP